VRHWLLISVLCATAAPAAQQALFRSGVDAVTVPVSVADKNIPVTGLRAEDFELLDNGVKQDVTVTAMNDLPTDLTFLVDVSGSVNGKALDRIKSDIQEMASLALPNDRVRLVSFARDAVDVFGQVPGGATLDFSRMSPGGITSLYDSLVTVLASTVNDGRPQMIFLMTDGIDNASFLSADSVTAVAQRSSAVLFVTLVQSSNPLIREGSKLEAIDPLESERSVVNTPSSGSNRVIPGINLPTTLATPGTTVSISRTAGPYKGGPNISALRRAAGVTGGLLSVDTSKDSAPRLFQRMLDTFRASYLLSYSPTDSSRGTHTISVKAKDPNWSVRARKSYETK
jgi:VWFA-related protein